MAQNANSIYDEVKGELQRFSGKDYKRFLKVKLRTIKFTKTSDIAKFSSPENMIKQMSTLIS